MRNGASLLLLTLVLSLFCCRSPALAHVDVNDLRAANRVRERDKKRRQRARAKEAAAAAAARAADERAADDAELHALRAQAQAHRAELSKMQAEMQAQLQAQARTYEAKLARAAADKARALSAAQMRRDGQMAQALRDAQARACEAKRASEALARHLAEISLAPPYYV